MKSVDERKKIRLRRPDADDGCRIWKIARDSGALDLNTPYHYLIMCTHFRETSIIADCEGQVAGFVSAYVPPVKTDAIFVWQIAVDHEFRGKGVGVDMLLKVADQAVSDGLTYLDATITPSNQGSIQLFRATAGKLDRPYEFDQVLFSERQFGNGHHEAEILFRIGPL